ncbi:hypothetical protein [Bacillus sp. FJAT-45350]|uniref:hypothetical protein n=1 Tax=Bacillus sp. FJAT-45350 TaxID=2011014 RepID=UPI000BB75833|nr:hypothetical protein [Bacillus sp. FJAT-45350]
MFKNGLSLIKDFFSTEVTTDIAPYHHLFNDRFMQKYTNFSTWHQFTQERTHEWDVFVRDETTFTSWNEMLIKAQERYVLEQPIGPYQFM